MGKRLIIIHGQRTTRHEIGAEPLVVGRDPGCDLFFMDQKLSRRHARVEPGPEGVKLIDLGSRNGSWVNEERIAERLLRPGDAIRVGGLRIVFEEDPPPAPSRAEEAEATVLLAAPPPRPDEGTVLLDAGRSRLAPPESPAEGTVLLREPVEPESGGEGTVLLKTGVLPRPAEAPPGRPLTGHTEGSQTLIRQDLFSPQPPAGTLAAPAAKPGRSPAVEAVKRKAIEEARRRTAAIPWRVKFALVLAGLGLLAYLVLAVPLVNTMRSALREESLLRGRALLNYLAATNAPLLESGRSQELSTDLVLKEPGVKDALILDPAGRVVAPSIRANESFERIEGIDKKTSDIYTFYLGRNRAGHYNLVLPLVQKGRRVGLAVLTYSTAGVAERGSVPALLILGFLLMAGGTYGAMVLAKRMTLRPMVNLRDDVEAVIKGDEEFVPPEQAYLELVDLAESVNRLIERAPSLAAPREVSPAASPAAVPPVPASAVSFAPALSSAAPDFSPAPAAPGWTPPPAPAWNPPPPAASWSTASPEPASLQPPAPAEGLAPLSASPPPDRPPISPPAAPAGALSGQLTIDENYIVSHAEPGALVILGAGSGELEGKHLIEAIKEQKLLEVVLDLVNAAGDSGSASGQAVLAGAGALAVSVSRQGGATIVSLAKL